MEDSQGQEDRQGSPRVGVLQVGHWGNLAGQSRAGIRGMSHRGRGDRSHREQGGRGEGSEMAGHEGRACLRA